jgi:hypothetical protein
MSTVAVLAVGLLTSTLLTSCNSGAFASLDEPTNSAPDTVAPGADAVAKARADLAAVPVKQIRKRDPNFDRDKFGDPWSDAGVGIAEARNGCDTRNDILRRDSKPEALKFRSGDTSCTVTAGHWISPYTGATITVPRKLDIDHVVSLGRAWVSGAKSWPAQKRLNFANDPDNLLAVDASSNRSKSDLGPGAWQPPKPYQCGFAIAYLRPVKKYELPLSKPDVTALKEMLDTCGTAGT